MSGLHACKSLTSRLHSDSNQLELTAQLLSECHIDQGRPTFCIPALHVTRISLLHVKVHLLPWVHKNTNLFTDSPSCSRTAPRRRQAMLAPIDSRRSNSLPTLRGPPPSTILPQEKASTGDPPASQSCAPPSPSVSASLQVSACALSCQPPKIPIHQALEVLIQPKQA